MVLNDLSKEALKSYSRGKIINLAHIDQFNKILVFYDRDALQLHIAKLEEFFTKKDCHGKIHNILSAFTMDALKPTLEKNSYSAESVAKYQELSELLVSNGVCILLNKYLVEINSNLQEDSQKIKDFIIPSCYSYKFRPQQSQEFSSNQLVTGPNLMSGTSIVSHPPTPTTPSDHSVLASPTGCTPLSRHAAQC